MAAVAVIDDICKELFASPIGSTSSFRIEAVGGMISTPGDDGAVGDGIALGESAVNGDGAATGDGIAVGDGGRLWKAAAKELLAARTDGRRLKATRPGGGTRVAAVSLPLWLSFNKLF